jgi:hypothetical protein
MHLLGLWFGGYGKGNDNEKAVSYYRGAAELGWKASMDNFAEKLRDGAGCVKDLRPAAISSAKGNMPVFWVPLEDAKRALQSRATEDFDCDFHHLCFALGWGLYWY